MPHYLKLLKELYQVNKKIGFKLGLDNIRQLNKALGHPDRAFDAIHVAGTNGKGTVSKKIAKCLECAGYKVGLFTSPHISTFRERIQINGEMISEEDVTALLSEIFGVTHEKKISATLFEIVTVLALTYFSEQNVDYAVLETGLGGRLDATNIIEPKLVVITSISLDHTDILGETLKEIAQEKAAIMKPGVPVVLGPHTPHIPRNRLCHEVSGIFTTPEEENRAIAAVAMSRLGIVPDPEGLNARLPCRMEQTIFDGVTVTFDIAHNPSALIWLFENLKDKPQQVVCGISTNKDVVSCMQVIQDHAKHMYLVEATNGRGIPVKELRNYVTGSYSVHKTIREGVLKAIKKAKKLRQGVLVCGTCYIMNEARETIGIEEPKDPVELNEKM